MAYGGHIAAIIAAKKAQERKEQEQLEEEKLTQYNSNDLDKYEFKIVRSTFGKFKNLQTVQQLCTEESKSGWEMVEKFDNNRIRFKRRTEKRSMDAHSDIDPYRTSYGSNTNGMVFVTLSFLLAALGIAVALFFGSGGYIEFTSPLPFILIGVVVFAIIMIIIKKKS